MWRATPGWHHIQKERYTYKLHFYILHRMYYIQYAMLLCKLTPSQVARKMSSEIFDFVTWDHTLLPQACWNRGAGKAAGGGALCVGMGFYADISWESRCSSEIKVWINYQQILVVFEVPSQPRVKAMSGNNYNCQKLIKGTQKLTSF